MPDTPATIEALSESEHTPTPWEITGDDEINGVPFIAINSGEMGTKSFKPICEVCSSLDEDYDVLTLTETDKANARFIVEAVNSHAALVAENAALKRALRRLITAAKMLQANAVGCAVEHYGLDINGQDLAGWLRDTQADIDAARALTPESLNTDIPAAGGEG